MRKEMMTMTPNFEAAATKAIELLIGNNISETPVNPMQIILKYPGVRVMPFTRMAEEAGMERHDLVPLFGGNQDAATFMLDADIKDVKYVVVYNMRLPCEIIRRAFARELGHIVLGHDGSTRPVDVRMAEAMCFAHHLLSPRPVIRMIQQSGMPLTLSVMSQTMGCSEECVEDIQKIPGVHVPKEMNIKVKKLFERGINEYIRFHSSSPMKDNSPVLDLGSFMDHYEE